MEVNKIKASLAQLLARLRAEHPDACEAILTKRYVLPNRLQGVYAPLDKLQAQDTCMLAKGLYYGEQDEMSKLVALNIEASLPYGRPTLYLEPELGEKLMCTDLPVDLTTDYCHWPRRSVRIMLPKGLVLMSGYDGGLISLVCLDFALIARGTSVDKLVLSAVSLNEAMSRIVMHGGDIKNEFIHFVQVAIGADWVEGQSLRELVETTSPQHRHPGKVEEQYAVQRLMFNLLIYMGSMPEEIQVEEKVIRKERREGKRIIPALHAARFVGKEHLRQVREKAAEDVTPIGKHYAAHWVRGFWRRQPHGPKLGLRKMIWIRPFKKPGQYPETQEEGKI